MSAWIIFIFADPSPFFRAAAHCTNLRRIVFHGTVPVAVPLMLLYFTAFKHVIGTLAICDRILEIVDIAVLINKLLVIHNIID